LVSPSSHGSIDEFDTNRTGLQPTLATLYKQQYVPFGRRIVIHPHQFMLAASLEYLRLPSDLMAYVIGRSTWGRLGLIVATAIGIQPGFAGTLTLELRNLGETPLALWPGQAIAQLFFHEVKTKPRGKGGLSQYSGAVDLLPRNMSSEITHDKIVKLERENKTP